MNLHTSFRHAISALGVILSAQSYCAHANDNDNSTPHKRKVDRMDWARKVKQFNLRDHLTKPTAAELKLGTESSRRLAHNHVRLGIDEEHHRKLVPENPPSGIVKMFTEQTYQNLPSTGPRLKIDTFMDDALPFGDGPGVRPGLPQGTRDFWLGDGPPTQMWEVSCLTLFRG